MCRTVTQAPTPTLYQVSPDDMGLDGREVELFNSLLATWQRCLGGNIRNEAYYRGKVQPAWQDKGQAPHDLDQLSVVVGWGAKAVDSLAQRSVLTGVTSEGGRSADELSEVVGGIDLVGLYDQAVTSELTDSCSFITVSHGAKGEPDAIVSAHSAMDAAAIWDARRKRIKAGISVLDIGEGPDGVRHPTRVVMYTDSYTCLCERLASGRWVHSRTENPLGRPLMEPLAYRPSLTRPFGKSRINKTVRSLIDRAMCVASRTEVSATFYTWPQRYLLGVDTKTARELANRKIETYLDRIIAVSTNKNGDTPSYGQLSQMSMQPHVEHMQFLAKQFAGETSVPLNSLGIVQDNPSSAEAMYAAQNDLIIEAEGINRLNGIALRNVCRMAMACVRPGGTLTDDDLTLTPRFANPVRPSMAARADFAIKVASAAPSYPLTPYFWRDLGYDETDTEGIMRAIQAESTRQLIAAAAVKDAQAAPEPTPKGE